jgi:hypothetical protein
LTTVNKNSKKSLFRPSLFETIWTMPASAATTKTTGYQVEFSKYPVLTLIIVMNSFNDITAPSRKRIFFSPGNQLIDFCQTLIAQTMKKGIGQKRFCFITQYNLQTAAG